MSKINTKTPNITKVGETDEELYAISIASETPFIRTLEDFEEHIARMPANSPFARLSAIDIEIFKRNLTFDQTTSNGQVYRSWASGMYFGDLVQYAKFTQKDIIKVMALFGVGAKRGLDAMDKIAINGCCWPRTYYTCFGSCRGGKYS